MSDETLTPTTTDVEGNIISVADPGFDWRCLRCGHQWRSRTPNAPRPVCCANCRSSYWDRAPRTKRAPTKATKRRRSITRRRHVKLKAAESVKTRFGIDGPVATLIDSLTPPPSATRRGYEQKG